MLSPPASETEAASNGVATPAIAAWIKGSASWSRSMKDIDVRISS
jgi:hypothetical protein